MTDSTAPVTTPTSATPAAPHHRRRRRARPDYVHRADRSTWRAVWVLLLPIIPAAMTYWYYTHDVLRYTVACALATVASALLLSPFILAWSIAAVRRGTRWLPLPVITGFIASVQLTVLLTGLTAAAVGYTVVTGKPVPGMERYPDVQKLWVEQDWHDRLLDQPYNGQPVPDVSGLLDKIPH